jgi:uncharacterized protein (TIGR02284 family)
MNLVDTPLQANLKNLIRVLHDGQLGFRHASENVTDPELKRIFSGFSLQRAKMAGELQSEALTLGVKDPQSEGTTILGAIYRGWLDLKAAFVTNDRKTILSAAESGEDSTIQAYREALNQIDLPAPLRLIISNQAAQVKAAHDQVKTLRDALTRNMAVC